MSDTCIRCKYTDCAEVCRVDCFYEGENMSMIHPDQRIDYGVCVCECPAEAIFADPDDVPDLARWPVLKADCAKRWPSIVSAKPPPDDAADWDGVADKLADHFSPNPE